VNILQVKRHVEYHEKAVYDKIRDTKYDQCNYSSVLRYDVLITKLLTITKCINITSGHSSNQKANVEQ